MKLSGIHFRLDLIVSLQVENRKQTLGACPNLSGISQGKQFTCYLTLKRVRVTIVAAEKQYALHILRMCL